MVLIEWDWILGEKSQNNRKDGTGDSKMFRPQRCSSVMALKTFVVEPSCCLFHRFCCFMIAHQVPSRIQERRLVVLAFLCLPLPLHPFPLFFNPLYSFSSDCFLSHLNAFLKDLPLLPPSPPLYPRGWPAAPGGSRLSSLPSFHKGSCSNRSATSL